METELKFQVAARYSDALRRAVATASARRTRLQAVYFDTEDRRLAAAGLALRLRREGRVWMQTLKGRGDGVASRVEHEVRVSAAAAAPALDPQRHDGTPAGAALQAALAGAGSLVAQYRTDIERLHRVVRFAGARIEIAHDRGAILAGTSRLAVDEVEFEWLGGAAGALPMLAMRWCERFGLWWDVRTKSEMGHRLMLGAHRVAPVKASAAVLGPQATPAEAWRAMLGTALAQALANAAELADDRGTPEHLHQLRVALRRLRSVLRQYAPWSGDAAQARALEAEWREPFAQLGAARDSDVLSMSLRAELAAAGAPAFDWPQTVADPTAAEVVRGPVFTSLLLRTLALSLASQEIGAGGTAGDAGAAAGATSLASAARECLRPLWRKVRSDAAGFRSASIEEQHRLRKRLKRLRYALEPFWPMLRGKAAARLKPALLAAMDALGDLNDLHVAEAVMRRHAEHEPRSWFAVGHIAARRDAALQVAVRRLAALAMLRLDWRD